jgi:hypothetical protein
MRHFSELAEGVRLLMEDELLAIAGGAGEDTDTPPTGATATDYNDALTAGGVEFSAHGGLTYVPVGEASYYPIENGLGHSTGGFYAHLPNGSYAYFHPGSAVEQTVGGTTRIIDQYGNVWATYSGS